MKELLYLCNKARGLVEVNSHDEVAMLRQAVNTLADAVQLLANTLTQGRPT